MPNSDEQQDPDALLDTVLSLLDETRMSILIDAPIDDALAGFTRFHGVQEPLSEISFVKSVARFLSYAYEHAFSVACVLSTHQAEAEAVHLLERHYEGAQARGYDGALLDVTRFGKNGMETALASLVECLKIQEREKYFRWVMVLHIGPLSWREKCQLVETLRTRWEALIPDEVSALPPGQLAYLLPELLNGYLFTIRTLKQIVSSSL